MAGKIIGITGGIGSGKSSVSRFWGNRFQLPLLDIDAICRLLMEKDQPGWRVIKQHFRSEFFDDSGFLDRKKLRNAIFQDRAMRATVDGLVHPLVLREMHKQLAALTGSALILAEIPLLLEAGWRNQVDHLVVIFADSGACMRRLCQRDQLTPQEAIRAIESQQPLLEKALQADHVVDNSGCWLHTRLQVMHLAGVLATRQDDFLYKKNLDRTTGSQ